MSKADNLKDFLTDVADAIRAKKGSTALINPQDFSAEIAALSGGLEVIEMTETTATIEPNKVYVWGMVESLDITLGASTDESDFFAFRFRCSKPTMTSVTVNGATWADDTELDAQGKPILDLGSWYQCEIKGGTSALYARLAHYIPFEDSNVEAVLLANGVGDGLGITYADAAKVTTISTWFKGNADITAFAEFINFSGITQLIKDAFYGCTSLAEITLPAGVTSIGGNAFSGCASLTEIALPASLTSIGGNAFRGCSLLARVLNLENTKVTSIGNGAFNGCNALAEIAFPASLTSIGNYAFLNCKSLTRAVNFENTQLTSISSELFKGCTSLAEITLPAGVTSIGGNAFSGCASLTEIALPASLTSIGGNAFRGCSLLARVLNLENTKVTSIGNDAFNGCSSLAGITLPASLTSIAGGTFNGCSSLAEITLPAGVTSIGGDAFNGCSSLAGITLPASLTSIAGGTFNGCSSLAEITLPAGVTSIGRYAFRGCSSLAGITLPASLTSIGYGAFLNTVIYGEFTFENLQTLDSRAFENTKVSKMKFPSLVSSEASSNYEGIFSYCTNLVLVDIGDKCTTIKSNSFGRFVGTNGNDITFIIRAITPPELADRLISTQWVKAKIGVIYVPDESLEAYKTATNWSYYADILKPLSEYTEK